MKAFVMALVASFISGLFSAPSAASTDAYNANDLWAYEDSVSLGERVTMWECWEEEIGGRPRLDQKVRKKWVRLDVASVRRDEGLCGKDTPLKATYEFQVRNSLSWNRQQRTYEAIVRTRCRGCQSYNWAIPVDK